MRVVLQRVSEASVTVDGAVVGSINAGWCALVGVTHGDDRVIAEHLARKTWELRALRDTNGATNRSLAEVGGAVLVVSQFTLYGDTRKGRRPSWSAAAAGEEAAAIVRHYADTLRSAGAVVAEGIFGADMQVRIVNDGPVTLILERTAEAS